MSIQHVAVPSRQWPFFFFFFPAISARGGLHCNNWHQVALVQPVFPWWQGFTCWALPQFVQQADGFGVRITSPLPQQPFAFHTPTQTCAPLNFEFQDNCLASASLISDQSESLPDKVMCLCLCYNVLWPGELFSLLCSTSALILRRLLLSVHFC